MGIPECEALGVLVLFQLNKLSHDSTCKDEVNHSKAVDYSESL
jgi:hypothetical protein